MGLKWDSPTLFHIHVPTFDAKHRENQAEDKGELLSPRSLKMEVRRKDKIHSSSSYTAICLPGSLLTEEETLSILGLVRGREDPFVQH